MAGVARFNDITPAQVDQLLAGLAPPTPAEKALAREVFNIESNIEQREISAWMKRPGSTIQDAMREIKRRIVAPMHLEDEQNRRDHLELQHVYMDKLREVWNDPKYGLIRARTSIILNIPGIDDSMEETKFSRNIRTLEAYYARNVVGGKRHRNKSKKSKRKSRKTRRHKH
jgi:hypothetical protein